MIDPLGELHSRADDAYLVARRLVFDVVTPPFDVEALTQEQRYALASLEHAEAALKMFRERAALRSRSRPGDPPVSVDVTETVSTSVPPIST